ncbi:hypothetical protein [Streptomyces sp. NPDC023588]|uniref:hypothetical protein n=1 Tax=Streptomyces sp. NPDC023588 TaxID=3154907 RepID=UPI0033FB521C
MPIPNAEPATKLLAGVVALGTATFGLIGATTGELALLWRNESGLTLAALICGFLLILATAYVVLQPKEGRWQALFAASMLLVGAVVGLLLWAKTSVQHDRVRPTVTTEWEMVGSSPVLKIATEADDVAESHVLWVGVRSGDDTLYSGATGPDVDGKAKQTAKVVVTGTVRGAVTVAAAIVPKTDSPVDGKQNVTCFGHATAIPPAPPAPSASPTRGSKAPQAACVALTNVPAPAPTGS